jgi:hypothetical protein
MGVTGSDNPDVIASLFAITAKPPALNLTAGGSGAVAFTVSFGAAPPAGTVPFSAHANLVPQNPAITPWLAIDGPPGRRFSPNSTEVYTVTVAVPANAAPGTPTFRLDMVGDENPDEQYTQGPTVALTVAVATRPKRRRPSWLWLIIAAVGVLIVGSVLAIVLTHGKGGGQVASPTNTPIIPSATPVPTVGPTITPTTAPTVVPPTIARVAVSPDTATSVKISFQASKDGSAEIMYTDAPDANGTLVNPVVVPAQPVQANVIAERTLTNLVRGTRYSYVIVATDAAGATTTTPVQHFTLSRGIVVTLKSLMLLNAHTPPLSANGVQCTTTLRYGVSERYASGQADERVHSFDGPSPGAISIEETFAEDPNRAIVVETKGTFISQKYETYKVNGDTSVTGCHAQPAQDLVSATMTLTPASNFAVGKDLTLVSPDFRTDIHVDERLSISTT